MKKPRHILFWLRLLLVSAGFWGSVGYAQIVYREVMATGNGGDPSEAMVDAIENAISQVGGMKMSSSTSMSMSCLLYTSPSPRD